MKFRYCAHALQLALFVVLNVLAQAENAVGVVYNDANANGIRDASEKGIAGVLVSNGVDIVATDKTGNYAITVTDETNVFVIKPKGWMTPLRPGTNVPSFYYIHKPKGTPAMKYAGVDPTGALPASIDFPLRKQREPNRFRVLCFGDTQTRNVEEVQFLAHDVLEELQDTDAKFGITLGDNVFNDLSVFEPLIETMSSIKIPWRYVPGNHDHNHDAPTQASTDDSMERFIGPAYYSFNYGAVHFVVLDDIRQQIGKEDYSGGLGEQQMTFVKNDLAHVDPKQLVVLLMHIPITEIKDQRDLYALLKDFPHTFSLSAHTHVQWHKFVGKESGWMQDTPHHHLNMGTACGSWWGGNFDEVGIPTTEMADGGPNNYAYIAFEGNTYEVEFKIPRRPADYQMNIWMPERIAAADTAKATVVANVFAGSSKSRVAMRLDDAKDWTPMTQYTDKDPYYLQMLARQDAFMAKLAELTGGKADDKDFQRKARQDFAASLRGMPKPDDTDHLWKANLPAGLASGAHTLTVETTDMFGRTYRAKRVFVVN
ncbi:MAG: calcineurin-like phosphoesterase family protein [Candidatus Hydrogenedentes bacterium]|nr:calcineurin-like phosphoesterase family protein [Candidatus Hydrogenedentota bacterium]